MKEYKFRIRERKFENGNSEFFPELLNEQNEWENIEKPCSFYYSKTYEESFQRILLFKQNNGIFVEEKIHDIN